MEGDHLSKSLSIEGPHFSNPYIGAGLISPVTLQMQKHLLSSTLQTSTEAGRVRPGRNGSCSPTPALPYTPTPSPSPFNPLSPNINSSLQDINLTLSGDTKTMNFLQDATKQVVYPGGAAGFDDMDVCERARLGNNAKFPDLQSIGPLPLVAVTSADMSVPRYSPQMEISSVLSFPEPSPSLTIPVSSQHDKIKEFIVMNAHDSSNVSNSVPLLNSPGNLDNNIRLLGLSEASKSVNILPVSLSSPMSPLVSELQLKPVPSPQLGCLTAIPSVTTEQIACITNLPTTVASKITCISAMPNLSPMSSYMSATSSNQNAGIISGGYDAYPTNKKRRLLTFLAEGNNVEALCSKNDQGLLVNQSQPSKSETFILSPACPSLMNVSSPTILLNPSSSANNKPEPSTIYLNPNRTPRQENAASTIFLSSEGPQTALSVEKGGNPDVFINQPEPINKNEQTLIINSDGTQATLITPVSRQATLIASQPQVGFLKFLRIYSPPRKEKEI